MLEVIQNEKNRIIGKGLQGFIGLVLTICYFCFAPLLVYPLYCLLPHHNSTLLVVVGVPIVMGTNRLTFNLIMNHIYASKYPYFEQYRIMNKPWPWEADEKGYSKQYKEIIINTMKGLFISFPLLLYCLIYFNLVEYVSDVDLYPSIIENFKDITIFAIVFETFFYWGHRLFHTPWLYKTFHKQHHEYEVTVSIAAIYNHPLDYMLTNIIPALLGQVFLGKVHVITVYFWGFYTATFANFLHCGYNMPWYPWGIFPLGLAIDYHDYHHSTNVGNYGAISIFWDTICGTNHNYYKSKSKLDKKN